MVYGNKNSVKVYFYDFKYDVGPYLIQLHRVGNSPLTICTPRDEIYNIKAIQDITEEGKYRCVNDLPSGDSVFTKFEYTLYLHNSLQDSHQLQMHYKYGDPPTEYTKPDTSFNFPINYNIGEIKQSNDYVGGNHKYSIYKHNIPINIDILKDKGDIHFWIGGNLSTPTNPPTDYNVTKVRLTVKFINPANKLISMNDYLGISRVNLKIGDTVSLQTSSEQKYYPLKYNEYTVCSTNCNLGDSTSQIDTYVSGEIQMFYNFDVNKIKEICLKGNRGEVIGILQPNYSIQFNPSPKLSCSGITHIWRKTTCDLCLEIVF